MANKMPVAKYEDKHTRIIQAALLEYWNNPDLRLPGKPITSCTYDKLTVQQINLGVIAIIKALNLSGGSIGPDFDLYRLLRVYLWSEFARRDINAIVDTVESHTCEEVRIKDSLYHQYQRLH